MTVLDILQEILRKISGVNWLVLAICTTAFLGFYLCDYRKWGCLSFNSYYFGFNFFLKIILMYPFAWSVNNYLATGSSFERVVSHLDQAFYLTLLGGCFMLLGIVVARVFIRQPPRGCEAIHDILVEGWQSSGGVTFGALIMVGATAVLFLLGFQPLVARSLVFVRNDLRPFYNLWSQLVPFFTINLILFGYLQRRWGILIVGLAFAGLGVLGGNRTVAILTLMQVGVMLAMPRRFRNLPMLVLGGTILLSAALWIGTLRVSSAVATSGFLFDILYGNNLSDLRDFAWILSGMDDHALYLGKTYIAGYLSFIPTYIFPFREIYGFGRVSPLLAGLVPMFHGGLRPPIFGEMYVNFGVLGVILGGFVYGFFVGRIMHWITDTLAHPRPGRRMVPEVVIWSGFLMLQVVDSFVFTPSFYGVYILVGILLAGRMLAVLGAQRA